MNEKNKTNGLGSFFKRFSKRLSNIGKGINIIEKDTIMHFIDETESDKIAEMIRNSQASINSEIRCRIHQPLDSFTKFEQSNLIVPLTADEEKHSSEIFEPFISKGYIVTPLNCFEPFSEYNVYLVSWK